MKHKKNKPKASRESSQSYLGNDALDFPDDRELERTLAEGREALGRWEQVRESNEARRRQKLLLDDSLRKFQEQLARTGTAILARIGAEATKAPTASQEERKAREDAKHGKEPPKGFEGLHESQKAQRYSDMLASAGLTDQQYKCASLAYEHGRPVKEIASRLRIHRKTVRDHLDAANKKIQMTKLKESGAKKMAKTKPGSLD